MVGRWFGLHFICSIFYLICMDKLVYDLYQLEDLENGNLGKFQVYIYGSHDMYMTLIYTGMKGMKGLGEGMQILPILNTA